MTDRVLLSCNEALSILEEHGAPKEGTNRQLLYWCVDHKEELPYSPVEIMRALFPHNPQNVRDTI